MHFKLSHPSPNCAKDPRKAVLSALLLMACSVAWADEPQASGLGSLVSALTPRAFFGQIGAAKEVTAVTVGAIWNPWDLHSPRWSAYLEGSISRWRSRGGYPDETGVLTQLAVIPTLRYRMDDGRSPWFAEGGIGATITSSVYRRGETRFSTAFNFGDHVGVGYSFGPQWKNEIVLRAEHFSNAGIKHPNPGQNFVQLRYVRHFD